NALKKISSNGQRHETSISAGEQTSPAPVSGALAVAGGTVDVEGELMANRRGQMTNDELRKTKEVRMTKHPNTQTPNEPGRSANGSLGVWVVGYSLFFRHSSFVIPPASFVFVRRRWRRWRFEIKLVRFGD